MKWDDYFQIAKEYSRLHGDLSILSNFITEEGIKLGDWITHQRHYYKHNKLSDDKYNKLNTLGMIWHLSDPWENYFNLAKDYYIKNGDLQIPSRYITSCGLYLGRWIHNMRYYYKTKNQKSLSYDRIVRLESIGMLWTDEHISWNTYFSLAESYFKKHGDLLIPKQFITSSGIRLGSWINYTRYIYQKNMLSVERINKLVSIGMV